MSETVFDPPPPVLLPVIGERAAFPVRRIYCVGRNYAAHAREMGADPEREPPFFFTKPRDAAAGLDRHAALPYPGATGDLHHEVELVVALSKGGRDIPPGEAGALIYGYGVGVDLTRRDLQAAAKAAGRPWDTAKGFDHSAPMGAIAREAPASDAPITLSVNGAQRQGGRLSDMIWSIPEVIAEASRLWTLAPGDLIFTGTPEGVGPLARGDRVEARIEGLPSLVFTLE